MCLQYKLILSPQITAIKKQPVLPIAAPFLKLILICFPNYVLGISPCPSPFPPSTCGRVTWRRNKHPMIEIKHVVIHFTYFKAEDTGPRSQVLWILVLLANSCVSFYFQSHPV